MDLNLQKSISRFPRRNLPRPERKGREKIRRIPHPPVSLEAGISWKPDNGLRFWNCSINELKEGLKGSLLFDWERNRI
jgi:hypothetical protein